MCGEFPLARSRFFGDGRTVMVTPNCEQVLLHPRQKFRPRRTWIDAVCIDQSSLSEKKVQVPMMGHIYRRATRTIIWLGPEINPGLTGVLRRASRYGDSINKTRARAGRERLNISDSASYRQPLQESGFLNHIESERIVRLFFFFFFFQTAGSTEYGPFRNF
jgi:hypothetical protein